MTSRPPLAAGVALVVAMLLMVTGCSAAAPVAPTLDDVVAERRAAVEAAERERFEQFIDDSGRRLDELGLVRPIFQGLVAIDERDAVVTACIEAFNPQLAVSRLEGGYSVNYFGVVGETHERIRWAIESCNAQYGTFTSDSAGDDPGPVESSWRVHDVATRFLPCLRELGVPYPDPSLVGAGAGADAVPVDDLIAVHGSIAARVRALCPTSDVLLEQHVRDGGAG